jgi:hypothetical protein
VRMVYISMTNFPARMTRCCRSRTRSPVSTSSCAVRVSTEAKAERWHVGHSGINEGGRTAAGGAARGVTCMLMLARTRSWRLQPVT